MSQQHSLPHADASAAASRVAMFGIHIDGVTMPQAVERIRGWYSDAAPPCRYVVTPNVDHIVKLQSNRQLLEAYLGASLVVADGWPVVAAARCYGLNVPERVAGSDLIPALCAAGHLGGRLRVFLLGAAPGVAELAASQIENRWPDVSVVGCYSPPLGFEKDPERNAAIIGRVNDAGPHLLVVGLGAPKQEIWLSEYARQLSANVAVAAGGTIDFLAGRQRRAPLWARRIGMEWLYRAATAPGRLGRRYLYDAWVFPRLFIREYFRQRKARRQAAGK